MYFFIGMMAGMILYFAITRYAEGVNRDASYDCSWDCSKCTAHCFGYHCFLCREQLQNKEKPSIEEK